MSRCSRARDDPYCSRSLFQAEWAEICSFLMTKVSIPNALLHFADEKGIKKIKRNKGKTTSIVRRQINNEFEKCASSI